MAYLAIQPCAVKRHGVQDNAQATAHKIVNTVTYLDESIPSGVVKNSNRRDHCTETFEVENDIGPSIGTEKRKLVW